MCAMRPSPNGFWLPVCIAKVVAIFNHRVASMPRSAYEGLEPCDGKLSRTILRGLGAGNSPRLPGFGVICDFMISPVSRGVAFANILNSLPFEVRLK
jgi:hypothetical protein